LPEQGFGGVNSGRNGTDFDETNLSDGVEEDRAKLASPWRRDLRHQREIQTAAPIAAILLLMTGAVLNRGNGQRHESRVGDGVGRRCEEARRGSREEIAPEQKHQAQSGKFKAIHFSPPKP